MSRLHAHASSLLGVGLLAMLAALAGAVSCAELDEAELGVCGNHIHEPEFGEDCDGSAIQFGEGASCGAPNGSAPCRLACTPQASETGCPPGWGCGTDGVCRAPSGVLESGTLPGEVRAVGDLDGDGRDDVVLRGPGGAAEVAFFTEGRNIAELFVDPARRPISDDPAVLPIVARLSSDGIDDLALPLIGDDVAIRVFMGDSSRTLENPFVELVTVPFGATGEVWMRTVFNPLGLPQSVCAIGGCSESLLLGKTKADETRYAVLRDRELVELFRLADGRRRQNAALARWDAVRSCDVLAVSYRYEPETALGSASPGNLVDLFSLCAGPGVLNQSSELDPLGTVPALTSVSVSDTDETLSLILSGSGDIDGDGHPDLLINITDNDPSTIDDGQTYALYGLGDGHFNSRIDAPGDTDLADHSRPLFAGHSWAVHDDPTQRIEGATWPRAMADINADGRADYLLTAGVVALSTSNPADTCVIAGETVLAGPGVGMLDEPAWGYACVLVGEQGLLDAASATRFDVRRNWLSSGSLATDVDLQGDGRPGFAAIDKNKILYTGQPTDHSPIDLLDLIWIDAATSQMALQTIESERIEELAAGDIDGDFDVDLLLGGDKLDVILGAPYDIARATGLSPAEFEQLQVFGEGRPSASVGAERDGRLTVFRDGQWPALALIEPGDCVTAQECHVRFAAGALGDSVSFGWALGVVQSSVGGGLRLLRAIEGEANLGPAYDSTTQPLLSLTDIGLVSVKPEGTTVVAIELDEDSDKDEVAEAIVIGRTETGVELSILRPYLSYTVDSPLCSAEFTVAVTDPESDDIGIRAVCFEIVDVLTFPGVARTHPGSEDPFVEVADADGDGNLDLSWVTVDNHVLLLLGGQGTFTPDDLIELTMPEPEEEDESGGSQDSGQDDPEAPEEAIPARLDWIRWIEFDGSNGRELVGSDVLGSGLLWGLDVDLDRARLEPLNPAQLDTNETRHLGYIGDFDGDGVDDIALGKLVLFRQPVND
jgi:hypothetical protein